MFTVGKPSTTFDPSSRWLPQTGFPAREPTGAHMAWAELPAQPMGQFGGNGIARGQGGGKAVPPELCEFASLDASQTDLCFNREVWMWNTDHFCATSRGNARPGRQWWGMAEGTVRQRQCSGGAVAVSAAGSSAIPHPTGSQRKAWRGIESQPF